MRRRLALVGAAAALAVALGGPGCRRRATVADAGTGTIEGHVVGTGNEPLGEAMIEIGADPPDGRVPAARTRTTAAGAFRVDRMPSGRYLVRAKHASHAPAAMPVFVPRGGAVRAELRLPLFVSLEGRIEDVEGTPIPLAHVIAVAATTTVGQAGPSIFHETNADAHGHFRFTDLAPGAHKLLIDAPGLGTVAAGPIKAPDPDVVVILPGESRSITGIVAQAGHVVAGAHVHLAGEAVSEMRTTETDLAGRFAFAGVGPGAYSLRAEAGGRVSLVLAEILVGRASSLRHVALELEAAVSFHGRVVDERGQGVANAAVRIDLVPPTGLWPVSTTDADGQWTSPPLGPGKYQLRPRRAGFIPRRTTIVEIAGSGVAAPTPPAAVTLEVIRAGEIVGRVLAEDGRPIAGAKIHDRAAEAEELGVISSPLPPASAAAALPGGMLPQSENRGGARQATSDADGRFRLADVTPGRTRLEILQAGAVPFRGKTLALAPGQKLDLGALTLAAATRVVGRVVDADGQPMPGARVAARGKVPGASDALYSVTDASGAFSLPLPAGDITLVASAAGHVDVEASVRVRSGAPGESQVTTLTFAKVHVRALAGSVSDGAGRPVGGARVVAFPRAEGPPPTAEAMPPALATARTDQGGHFVLEHLPDGPVWLEVRHDSYAPRRAPVDAASAGTSDVAIHLPMPGAIWGEVHERVTGAPVARFQVEALGPDGAVARFPASKPKIRTKIKTTTDRRGDPFSFRLGPLSPGEWTLRVTAPGYTSTEHHLAVPSAGALAEPSVRGLRLELDRTP